MMFSPLRLNSVDGAMNQKLSEQLVLVMMNVIMGLVAKRRNVAKVGAVDIVVVAEHRMQGANYE
jgi:hypothetical protein